MHVIVSKVEVSIVSEFRAGDRRIAEFGRNHLPAQMKSGHSKGVSNSDGLTRRCSRSSKVQQETETHRLRAVEVVLTVTCHAHARHAQARHVTKGGLDAMYDWFIKAELPGI